MNKFKWKISFTDLMNEDALIFPSSTVGQNALFPHRGHGHNYAAEQHSSLDEDFIQSW